MDYYTPDKDNYFCYILMNCNYESNNVKKLSDKLYKIIWISQKKCTRYDFTIKKGSYIFSRKESCIPYTYIGKVITNPIIIQKRSSNNPIILEFFVYNKNKPIICNNIDYKEHFKFQNACWRTLKLSPFKANSSSIYKIKL